MSAQTSSLGTSALLSTGTFLDLEKRHDGVAVVWFDNRETEGAGAGVNKLSSAMFNEAHAAFARVADDPTVSAVVLASRKSHFIVGADIREIETIKSADEAARLTGQLHAFLGQLERSAKPVIAAIDGDCLGGGLELALACHARIASDSPKTALGLPEVMLGLLPGGGGTQRLPRLIGVSGALDLMLTGRKVRAAQALKMGLVDVVTVRHGLVDVAARYALEIAAGGRAKPVHGPKKPFDKLLAQPGPATLALDIVLNKAKAEVLKKTRGKYPAPLLIIESVGYGLKNGLDAGLVKETELFAKLVLSPESARLRELFFAMTALKKSPLADKARPISTVGVLGAGLMGAGIAYVTANEASSDEKPLRVLLKDTTPENVSRGIKTIGDLLGKKVKRKALSRFAADTIMARVQGTTRYEGSGFDKAEIVVEAVFEDLALKRRVLAECEAATPDHCIFASNTSALPIAAIAAESKRPGQVLGLHYFSPVHRMPLLEIITTPQTEEWVTATGVELGIAQGKTVIVVKDAPGFYTTRILAPYLNETLLSLDEGASVEDLDHALLDFGFPVGPVALIDEVGIDVGAHVSKDLGAEMQRRRPGTVSSLTLSKLVEAGFKGRKNNKGFYRYEKPQGAAKFLKKFGLGPSGKPVNDEVYAHFGGPHRKKFDPALLQERLALAFVLEAVRALEDTVIASPRDGDVGAILGLGFPPFLGGPFRYIDTRGAADVVRGAEALRAKLGPAGANFEVPALLRAMATSGQKFYNA
jgi:3-hydroxyacyl-CoA dehydrogenase / enoyl-CoA hydratase / 3-hydroxybutyryl-CoA epimerase